MQIFLVKMISIFLGATPWPLLLLLTPLMSKFAFKILCLLKIVLPVQWTSMRCPVDIPHSLNGCPFQSTPTPCKVYMQVVYNNTGGCPHLVSRPCLINSIECYSASNEHCVREGLGMRLPPTINFCPLLINEGANIRDAFTITSVYSQAWLYLVRSLVWLWLLQRRKSLSCSSETIQPAKAHLLTGNFLLLPALITISW